MPLKEAKPRYIAPRQTGQTRTHKFGIFPAPNQGLDITQPLVSQNPQGAVLLDNWFCRRYGNELRSGYLRWNSNLGGLGTPSPVRSVMAYFPPRSGGIAFVPKLFAACANGNIYDVTDRHNEAFVPPVAVAIPGQIEPGEFSHTQFATLATNYLCICSAGGGYWTYDTVGGWVNRTGAITGPGAAAAINFDFVFAWKNRLWFIQDGTTDAWYLGAGNIAGASANFDFGPLFVHGGDLKAMASWTVDAGDGLDDKMVVASASGDILIYQGTDPASASTFGIIGRWFIGQPPSGRRFFTKYGGDLSIITERGIEYMSRIMQGLGQLDPQTQPKDPVRRFNEIIGRDVRATRQRNFWQFLYVSGEEAMILITPHSLPQDAVQYCYSTLAQGWSRMRDMPMVCGEILLGDLYFGTEDGKIGKAFYGFSDDVLFDGTPGKVIVGDIQTAFIAPEDDRMSLKRSQFIMPMFLASAPPSVKAQVNTEWVLQGTPGSPPYSLNANALWDSAIWNVSKWGGEDGTYQLWLGATGLGCYASLRMSVQGPPRTLFTSWKYVYESGGIM